MSRENYFQNFHTFDNRNLSAWLYKITYNKSLNKLKRRKFLFWSAIPENAASPDEGFSDGESALSVGNIEIELKNSKRNLRLTSCAGGYNPEDFSFSYFFFTDAPFDMDSATGIVVNGTSVPVVTGIVVNGVSVPVEARHSIDADYEKAMSTPDAYSTAAMSVWN